VIRRRQVFYVPGYDPRGVAPYYRLFRSELRRHAEMRGLRAATGRLEKPPDDAPWLRRWRATRAAPAATVEAIVDFCGWDDLIEDEARLGLVQSVWRSWRAAAAIIANRMIGRIGRLSRRSLMFMVYPHDAVALYLLTMAAMIGEGLAYGALLGPLGAVGGGLVGIFAAARFYRLTRRADARLYIWHLAVHWDFLRRQGQTGVPELAERSRAIAARIKAAIDDPAIDEVVVVGHSHGCYVTIGIVARVLEMTPALGRDRPGIALLNLGTALPSAAYFGPSEQFRRDLAAVITSPLVTWYEASAHHDILSARSAYVTDFGIDLAGRVRREPIDIPINFREVLTRETLSRLRWSFYRLHFQYLMASETGRGYDYFDLIFSPAPFVARDTAGAGISPAGTGRVAQSGTR